jgi:general secretion pathway protein B
LDALKKSDSERQQRQGPTLASVHRQTFLPHNQRRSLTLPMLVCAGAVVVAASVWLYQRGYVQISLPVTNPVALQKMGAPVAIPVEPAPLSDALIDSGEVASVRPTPQKLAAANPETTKITAPDAGSTVQVPLTAGAIPELWQLPGSLREGIPELDFSLHVYSTQPDQRSIIINNRMMREGEYVNPLLALSAITPDGVVMRYRNEYFRASILDKW